MNCFSYQSYQSYQSFPYQQQSQPMYFGNCQPFYPQIPQACPPMGGNYLAESNYWSQLMQCQQNLFQGWQGFCGCQQQQPPQFGCQPPQFGCQPPQVNINIHHHWIDCPQPQQQQPQPQPQPQPRPPRPTPRPLPRPPLTRTNAVPQRPAPSRPQPAPLPPATPDRTGTRAAHTYGAFGPGGGTSTFVGNASLANNTYGGQAVVLDRGNARTTPQTHLTATTVTGFRP